MMMMVVEGEQAPGSSSRRSREVSSETQTKDNTQQRITLRKQMQPSSGNRLPIPLLTRKDISFLSSGTFRVD